MSQKCFVNIKTKLMEAEFLGVYQYSNVIEPSLMVGGHNGGVIAYPVAVVRVGTELKEVKLSSVLFKK